MCGYNDVMASWDWKEKVQGKKTHMKRFLLELSNDFSDVMPRTRGTERKKDKFIFDKEKVCFKHPSPKKIKDNQENKGKVLDAHIWWGLVVHLSLLWLSVGGPIPTVDRSAALAMVNTLGGHGRQHRENCLPQEP